MMKSKYCLIIILILFISSSAFGKEQCSPDQWAARFAFQIRVGEPRCCNCIGTPEECKNARSQLKPFPGCAQDITFLYNSSDLTTEARSILTNFGKSLRKINGSDIHFTLNGHTDTVGSGAFNVALSKRRAERVRRFLETHNFGAKIFQVKAYGAAMPKQGATSTAELRRVEIHLVRSFNDQ